jgi:hypothetical protein
VSAVSEHRPRSFLQYVRLIEGFQQRASGHLWYRGCNDASHKLLPSLYRHRDHNKPEDFIKLEEQLMVRFRQRSLPLVSRQLGDDWDLLFFMQHYGVPTRLLDWTENPFIGIFFAVMSEDFKSRHRRGRKGDRVLTFKTDAAVWVLDPERWNEHALRHQHFSSGIVSPVDAALSPYKPPAQLSAARNAPIAMYGAHNSPRIVAQRGEFTIFGQTRESMEELYVADVFPAGCLSEIILSKSVIPALRRAVLRHGITESAVYPDLEGLAREINRDFGFED